MLGNALVYVPMVRAGASHVRDTAFAFALPLALPSVISLVIAFVIVSSNSSASAAAVTNTGFAVRFRVELVLAVGKSLFG